MPSESTNPQRESADPAAWLSEHGDALYAYAMSRLRDPEAAEELVQETLLTALRCHASFEGRSSLRTWLTGILRYRILEHRRATSRRSDIGSLEHGDDLLDNLFTRSGRWNVVLKRWGHHESRLESEELRDAVNTCVASLPGRTGDAVMLRIQQDMSPETVASLLGVSTNNLSVILHRARAALRQCVETKLFGVTEKVS